MGSGKTYWAKHLSQAMRIGFMDTDFEIEQSCNADIASLFSLKGETFFRDAETQTLQQIIANTTASTIIATGGGTACHNNNMQLMLQHGTVIWLNEAIDICAKRLVEETNTRPLIKHLNKGEIETVLTNQLQQRNSFYAQANFVLNPNQISSSSLQKIITQYV